MVKNTKIEWAHHTFNPWEGCSKVHTGCANCYAETRANRFGSVQWGPNGTRRMASAAYWKQPLKWNAEAEANERHVSDFNHRVCGDTDIPLMDPPERPRVFCASLADIFEDWQGEITNAQGETIMVASSESGHDKRPMTMDDLRLRLFRLFDATPCLDWLVLTKRPENVFRMMEWWLRDRMGDNTESPPGSWKQGIPINNLWLGTSVSDQPTAESAIPHLLELRDFFRVLFLSAEPLVRPIQLDVLRTGDISSIDCLEGTKSFAGFGGSPGTRHSTGEIDWVIVGGESGPGARKCDADWIRDIVAQCGKDVPCFVKQVGSNPVDSLATAEWPVATVESLPMVPKLADPKGGDPSEWPAELQFQRFPEVS